MKEDGRSFGPGPCHFSLAAPGRRSWRHVALVQPIAETCAAGGNYRPAFSMPACPLRLWRVPSFSDNPGRATDSRREGPLIHFGPKILAIGFSVALFKACWRM